jgi:hypothetical protein
MSFVKLAFIILMTIGVVGALVFAAFGRIKGKALAPPNASCIFNLIERTFGTEAKIEGGERE